MSAVSVPRHIYWSCRERASVDGTVPSERNWLLEQTLAQGTMSDIRALDLAEVEAALPTLNLPRHVRALWRSYFERQHVLAPSEEPAPATR